jgi:hypothetical protein
VTRRPRQEKWGKVEGQDVQGIEWIGNGESLDLETWKRRREEIIREGEQDRLAKESRASRERRGSGRVSAPVWELRRAAGRLLKLLRILGKPD